MRCWEKDIYLITQESLLFRIPDGIQVDVYRCPQCGKLEFFQANFVPKKPVEASEESETDTIDTSGYYTPGVLEDVKCPVCGKLHPADDPYCPLCGTKRK
jgi:rubrerythrin